MKKYLLLLLLFTGFLQSQTYPVNPTKFGKISLNTNVPTTQTKKIVSQDTITGELNYIDADNFPIPSSIQDSLAKKINLPTGFLYGLQLSINADPTKFDIAAGYYTVTDFSNLAQPVVKIMYYPGGTGLTPSYLATSNSTYVALDINGDIVSSASPFTNEYRRTLAIIGNVVHSNNTTINVVNEIKAPIVAFGNQLHDFMKEVGFLNSNGNIYSPNGANLMINKSAGRIFGMGINAADYLNPHVLTIAEQTAPTFAYRLQTGTQLADTNAINPNIYDVGGVSTAIPGGSWWTIQRINLFQSGLTRIQPGQTIYPNFNSAVTNLPTEPFITEQNIADNAVFRCYLIVEKGTTNLAAAVAAGTARFVPVDKFGNVINSGSVPVTAENIIAALGYTPENVANKSDSYTASSSTTYASTKALVDGLATKQNTLTNPITGVGSQNDPNTYALQNGTILYHSVKWFTPTGEVSTTGTTVTSVGTQFTSAMVGAKLTINGEWRIITGYTSSTVVTVASAYSQNYIGVVAGSWGVYSKAYSIAPEDNQNYSGGFSMYGAQKNTLITSTYGRIQLGLKLADASNNVAFNTTGVADSFQMAADKNIVWHNGSSLDLNALNTTKDLGIRRKSAGLLELYNGVTADGAIGNRRDLLARNVYSEPATLPNQVVTKAQLDATIPETYSIIVYVNTTSPNTATVFDDVNPPVANDDSLKANTSNLYIGTDASSWVYDGSFYVTKSLPRISNFYLKNSIKDAGNVKHGHIERFGPIEAPSFIKADGTSSEFLKADGSSDTTAYAPLASPSFTGTPTAPTAPVGTNTTQIATTAFVLANSGSSKVMNATGFDGYGDSMTYGQNSYINLLGTLYGKTVVNRAVSGRGIWEAGKQFFANVSTSSTTMPVVMAGFNDLRRGGSSVKTTAKIINGYKSIIANQFLNSFISGGTTSTSIVRTGTWYTNYTGISIGLKTDTGTYSNTSGNYIEYTFTDNNIVIGLVAGDGVTQIHSDFTVLIDGVSQGTYTLNNQTDGISDGSNDNARSPMCLIFTGLSEGTHTVKLTNSLSRSLIIDYFGHLKQPKFCTPILVMKVPKMDATGYATSPNLANDAIINQLNTDLDSLVATFPSEYPILIADTNSYYDVATGLDTSDHIHPNNIGHRQIYTAAYTALNSLLLGGTSAVGATTSANNTFTGLNIFTQQLKGLQALQIQGVLTSPTGAGIELEYNASGGGFTVYDRITSAYKTVIFRGSSIESYVNGTLYSKMFSSGNISFKSGGTYTDSGERMQIDGSAKITQNLKIGKGFQIQGTFLTAPSGEGIEQEYLSGVGYVRAYNRGTSTWKPLNISGSDITFGIAAVENFKITSGNNVIIQNGGTFTDNGDRLQVAGSLSVSGVIKAGAQIRLKNYTVATLPSGTQGDTAFVTDATAPTYLGTLTGGGTVVCPVFYNGTAWVAH